jgi:hypothetical protein
MPFSYFPDSLLTTFSEVDYSVRHNDGTGIWRSQYLMKAGPRALTALRLLRIASTRTSTPRDLSRLLAACSINYKSAAIASAWAVCSRIVCK